MKKNKIKIFISVLFVFCMIFTLLSPAFAYEKKEPDILIYTGNVPKIIGVKQETDEEYSVVYYANTEKQVNLPDQAYSTEENRVVIIEQGPKAEGLEFVAWNTKPDGSGEDFIPGDEVEVYENLILFAIWKQSQPLPAEDEHIAVIYLCVSGPRWSYIFGHSWICIKNISDKPIVFESQTIEPGKMISIGLRHAVGRCYNMEMSKYKGQSVQAKKKELTAQELKKVEDEVTKDKWTWYELFTHNCTNFAVSVWRSATGQSFVAFCFPFVVQIQMAASGTENLTID